MGGATGSGGEVKAGLLDFLPPAGALPAVIRRALAPATEDAAAAAGSTPRSLTRKGKSEDAARRLKSKLGHLVGFEFETCPPFNKKHFRQKTKSSEENERAKRLAAESIAAGNAEKERMQRSLWFTRAQDNALVRGVERYGLGDWGAVIESDPVFAGLECPLEALPVRFAVLKEAFHGDDEILVARNIDGEEGVLLKIEKGARGRPRVASVGIKSENEDFCSLCEQGGDLLLCDGCPRSYHLPCLGIEEPPEEDEWFCPECLANAKDIVDDSELDDRSWRDYIKVFMDVGTAKASSEERNAEFLESQDGEEIEGIVTQTLKRMVQAPDADFEKITREIEGLSGFVSENIPKAESKLLQQFVDRYETELKGRSDKRQDGKPGGGPEDDEEEDDDDDEEDDEEEDDEEEDEDDDVDEEDEEDDDEEDDDDEDDEEDDDEEDDEEDDGMVREDDEEDDDDPPIPEVAESDLDSDTDNEGSRAGVTASSGSRGSNKREASGSGSRRSGGGTGIIDAGDEEGDDDDEGEGSGHNSDARRKAKRPRMSSSPRHKTSAGAEASTKKTAAAVASKSATTKTTISKPRLASNAPVNTLQARSKSKTAASSGPVNTLVPRSKSAQSGATKSSPVNTLVPRSKSGKSSSAQASSSTSSSSSSSSSSAPMSTNASPASVARSAEKRKTPVLEGSKSSAATDAQAKEENSGRAPKTPKLSRD